VKGGEGKVGEAERKYKVQGTGGNRADNGSFVFLP